MKEEHSASFKAFFDEWSSHRIQDMGSRTDPSDWHYIISERSKEIVVLANKRGFRMALEDCAKSYGSVRGLVEYMFERKKLEGRD